MANEQNLVPIETLSSEEAKKRGKNGGIRSGEVRREKATFKNAIKWLIESDIKITDGNIHKAFKNSGIDISKLKPTQVATIGLWYGAVQGNATNYKTLMEANNEIDSTVTETPSVTVNIVDNSDLEKVMYDEEVDNETIQSK